MADLESFREETRKWLLANAPESMRTPAKTTDELCWGGKHASYTNRFYFSPASFRSRAVTFSIARPW